MDPLALGSCDGKLTFSSLGIANKSVQKYTKFILVKTSHCIPEMLWSLGMGRLELLNRTLQVTSIVVGGPVDQELGTNYILLKTHKKNLRRCPQASCFSTTAVATLLTQSRISELTFRLADPNSSKRKPGKFSFKPCARASSSS